MNRLSAVLAFTLLLNSCAYLPPRFERFEGVVRGKPSNGKLSIEDSRDIARLLEDKIYLRERARHAEFQKELRRAVEEGNKKLTSGIPGEVHNRSWLPAVTFYIIGPLQREEVAYLIKSLSFREAEVWALVNKKPTSTFTVNAYNMIRAELSPGIYVCYFLEGERELGSPRILGVNYNKKWLFGKYVNWGVFYVQ